MRLYELQTRAVNKDKTLIFLEDEDIVREGDYLEWLPNVFTTIDEGSVLIGFSKKCITDSMYDHRNYNYKIVRIRSYCLISS